MRVLKITDPVQTLVVLLYLSQGRFLTKPSTLDGGRGGCASVSYQMRLEQEPNGPMTFIIDVLGTVLFSTSRWQCSQMRHMEQKLKQGFKLDENGLIKKMASLIQTCWKALSSSVWLILLLSVNGDYMAVSIMLCSCWQWVWQRQLNPWIQRFSTLFSFQIFIFSSLKS